MAEIHMLDNQLSALTKKQIKIRLNERAPAMSGKDSDSEGDNGNENEIDDDVGGEAGKEETHFSAECHLFIQQLCRTLTQYPILL